MQANGSRVFLDRGLFERLYALSQIATRWYEFVYLCSGLELLIACRSVKTLRRRWTLLAE